MPSNQTPRVPILPAIRRIRRDSRWERGPQEATYGSRGQIGRKPSVAQLFQRERQLTPRAVEELRSREARGPRVGHGFHSRGGDPPATFRRDHLGVTAGGAPTRRVPPAPPGHRPRHGAPSAGTPYPALARASPGTLLLSVRSPACASGIEACPAERPPSTSSASRRSGPGFYRNDVEPHTTRRHRGTG